MVSTPESGLSWVLVIQMHVQCMFIHVSSRISGWITQKIHKYIVIVHSLSLSQFALPREEDRDGGVNEEHTAGPSYCSHFLPCQLPKLWMMFLFVLHFICCKMVDLAQTNTWCADPPNAVNPVVRTSFWKRETGSGWQEMKTFERFHSWWDMCCFIKNGTYSFRVTEKLIVKL